MTSNINVSIVDHGAFKAVIGATLLDAALQERIDIPFDCRVGSCGTCRVRLVEGAVEGGETGESGYVLACQCKVRSDIVIAVDKVPPIASINGQVISIAIVSDDVVEVAIKPAKPLAYLPGQYCQFQFHKFPMRAYSPTVPLDGPVERESIRLHVRRVPEGRVSGALGKIILPGHKVRIVGPFGSAYLRPRETRRLILVSSGTGFAPIWAIAHAALSEMPDREVVVIPGSRTRESIYMGAGLLRLATFPRVHVVPVVSKGPNDGIFPVGSPVDFVPLLSSNDIVFVCGAPGLVDAVSQVARNEGAPCFADAFEPSPSKKSNGFLARVRELMPLSSG